jgi:hypothetical protein
MDNFAIELQNFPQCKNFIFAKTEYRLEKILIANIIYIEGMRENGIKMFPQNIALP